MFKIFFFSEIKSALKQPMVYIFLFLMTLLTFGATASDNVQIGGAIGNIHKNAPYVITIYTTVMTIFGLIIATAFFNNAALRDYSNNFNQILFSTPLSKAGYYFGRFFGALLLSTIPMLGVFLGVILGSVLGPAFGWVDADRFGSFYLETFTNNYFLFILPNMFFAGAILYTLANKWKSTVISFVGALAIIMGYFISGTLVSDIDNETLGALIDVFGIRAYSLDAKYFTPIEKNTLSPGFSGLIIYNRLIWISIGLLILIVSYFTFSFQEKNKKVKTIKEKSVKVNSKIFDKPQLNPAFDGKTDWKQFVSFFKLNFLSIVKSVTFKILFLFSAILLISSLVGGYDYFGLQSYPVTYKIIDTISSSTVIFTIIILVFFSGELVWRDRASKINEVVDATPHTSLISLFSKALSLVSITVILHLFFILCGIVYQLINGFTRIDIDVYLLDFLYSSLPMYIAWSGIMITIQVLFNNKYIGYFVSILFIFIWELILNALDVESNMLSVGGPSTSYSDLNSFGPSLVGKLWFNLYWILFSLICLLIAGALWNRGAKSSLKERFLISKKQIPKSFRLMVITAILAWVAVASFVFYNTQILNEYKTSDQNEELSAVYEKTYKIYEDVTLPKIHDVKYTIDIFPHKRDVIVNAKMVLVNESNYPIDSVHYTIDPDWEPEILIPNSDLVLDDEDLNYRIYKLNKPLKPGERINIEINTKSITEGFNNGGEGKSIVNNGTFINNFTFLPALGYQSSYEISDKNDRKKYDLLPKERMPKLEANCTDKCEKNYLTNGTSDYINVETIISTSEDQIALAPGTLLKEWKDNGRNYYHYKVEQASQNFYSFMSADYQKKSRKWNGIDIEVYYDIKHEVNIDMMLDAVERSLAYYTKNFGPYMHKQARIVEFPRYATFAQAFPGTMPYSESLGFISNLEDDKGNNVVDAVISHEMAHQWWAHQVVGANIQGSTMMSESFAEYSSLMTLKSITDNPMEMREFIKYDHDRYLRGRSRETVGELPLYKVENQQHIHYGKGSVILYALQDYIGEKKVNTAMKSFLEEYRYKTPYPTSLDFMRYLEPQIPDSLNYVINDWFKTITLYDNKLEDASYKKLDNGKYQINLKIKANKILADSIGNESPMLINDWVDVGAFADTNEEHLIFEKRVKFNKPEMELTFEIDTIPAKLAIDPRHLLIDRVYSDNIKTASEIATD